MVYYFHVRWSEKCMRIFCTPLFILQGSTLGRKLYYKIHKVEYSEQKVLEDYKTYGVDEFWMKVVNLILLFLPGFALIILVSAILYRLSFSDNCVFVFAQLAIVIAFYLSYKVNEHLLEKKNRYKRLFREFDAMFKNDVWKRRRYGALVFLTDVFLISITVIIIRWGDVIRNA